MRIINLKNKQKSIIKFETRNGFRCEEAKNKKLFLNYMNFDLDRIAHLYSERAATEPETLNFWKAELRDYCLRKGKLDFTSHEIIENFTFQGILPAYFDRSLDRLITSKDISLYEDSFTNSSSLFIKWISNFWQTKSEPSNVKYSSCLLLKELSEILLTHFQHVTDKDRIFMIKNIPNFEYAFSNALTTAIQTHPNTTIQLQNLIHNFKEEDLSCFIRYLVVSNQVVCFKDCIQLLSSSTSQATLSSKKNLPNLETNASILILRLTLHDIQTKLEKYHIRKEELHQRALRAKQLNDKNGALIHLKLKKNIENTMNQLWQVHYNLEESLQVRKNHELILVLFD
jgi:hypothetical protein